MKRSLLALLVTALAGAACGNSDSSVTAPATSTTNPSGLGSTETFFGLLAVQGSSVYSFTVTAAETVTISLASLSASTIGPASTAVVRLGLGAPADTDCGVTSSVDTAAGLTAQLTAMINVGTYCVKILDIGNLPSPANFTIRIGHGVGASSSNATPTTDTFSSFLSIGGSSAHTFPVSQGGTISLTLTSVTPSSTVGVAIGIPSSSSSICELTSSLNATAATTAQISLPVDPGTYCAEVYDPGTVKAPGVAFSLAVTHP